MRLVHLGLEALHATSITIVGVSILPVLLDALFGLAQEGFCKNSGHIKVQSMRCCEHASVHDWAETVGNGRNACICRTRHHARGAHLSTGKSCCAPKAKSTQSTLHLLHATKRSESQPRSRRNQAGALLGRACSCTATSRSCRNTQSCFARLGLAGRRWAERTLMRGL